MKTKTIKRNTFEQSALESVMDVLSGQLQNKKENLLLPAHWLRGICESIIDMEVANKKLYFHVLAIQSELRELPGEHIKNSTFPRTGSD